MVHALKKKERFDIMSKGFNITAIFVFLISMSSTNHAYADGHRAAFCLAPYKGVKHDECVNAINKGVRMYHRNMTSGVNIFLYDNKWFEIHSAGFKAISCIAYNIKFSHDRPGTCND